MHSSDVQEQIAAMGELPVLPQTLLRVQKVATDDRSSADDLAEVILKDQALTLRCLKMVNSAFYQRPGGETVRTVRRAVVVLGFESVRKLALALSVFDMMSKLSRSPHLVNVAEHSAVVAAFARQLAELCPGVAPDEAFVAALVHDIGKVVLMECSPRDYDKVLADVANGVDTLDAERKHFGMSHPRAGRKLAARWKLPSELQALIGDHHDVDPVRPPRHAEPLAIILAAADLLTRFTGRRENAQREADQLQKIGRALGVPAARLEEVYANLGDTLSALADGLDLELGDLRRYAAVVNAKDSASVAPPLSDEEISARTEAQLRLYQGLGQGMAEGRDPQKLLQSVVDGAHRVLGFERVVLLATRQQRFEPWLAAGPGAADLMVSLGRPVSRELGPLAMCVLQRRSFHVPMAQSDAYGSLEENLLVQLTQTNGYAVAPVVRSNSVVGALFADMGPQGPDVAAELASELSGLAVQAGLVLSSTELA